LAPLFSVGKKKDREKTLGEGLFNTTPKGFVVEWEEKVAPRGGKTLHKNMETGRGRHR